MTKEKIKNLILSVQEFQGYLTLNYFPISDLYLDEKVYNLYYSGFDKIEIGKYFTHSLTGNITEITPSNIDEITDKVYNLLIQDVSWFIQPALENLKLDFEDLKYFENNTKKFKKFQNEVLKLKNTTT